MKQYLNFGWQFTEGFEEQYLTQMPENCQTVDIPHNVAHLPYNYFDEKCYQKLFTYQKTFDVAEQIEGKTVTIRFEAFMTQAQIYLNGHTLGHYVSAYNPVEIDVSTQIKQRGNTLTVALDATEDEKVPPFGYAVDYLTFGGIYREVSVNVHPKLYVEKSLVSGDMHGNVEIRDIVKGDNSVEHKITHQIFDGERLLCEREQNCFCVENPTLWSIETPRLYTLKSILKSTYGISVYQTTFGFRSVEFTTQGFFLNGNRVKLVGLNRHQSYPHVGYAMPKRGQTEDADLLKYEAGVNVVRTSHYPQSEHFLNRCDQIGLLVINEIPGWQHISKLPEWRNQYYENVRSMVTEEYNHPSLIAHGVRIDESMDDFELYQKGNQIAHEIDKTRQTLGVRNFKNSQLLEDVYAYNDFVCADMSLGLINPKKVKTHKKPYLVTEYMGHMEPTKATDSSAQRIYHALRHAKVLDDCLKYPQTCGCIGWCFADYYTHVDFGSGDHICPHGVFDMYRNKKYASAIYQSQQDETPVLEVLSNMRPGDFVEATYQQIYVATNADYVELYKNGQLINKFYPNNKQFKNLKHPPILIDDLVGRTFVDKRFNKKDSQKISKLLSYVAFFGIGKLKPSQYLTLGLLMAKYKLKYDDFVALYNEHVAAWGGKAKTFTFVGHKNGKAFKQVNIGPSLSFDLKVTPTTTTLQNGETYDVSRVALQYVDQHGNVMPYANKPVLLQTEGPIKLLCSEAESLLAGQLSVYVRSLQGEGHGKLIVKCEGITKEISFEVKNI